jgi:hypothetical protein
VETYSENATGEEMVPGSPAPDFGARISESSALLARRSAQSQPGSCGERFDAARDVEGRRDAIINWAPGYLLLGDFRRLGRLRFLLLL